MVFVKDIQYRMCAHDHIHEYLFIIHLFTFYKIPRKTTQYESTVKVHTWSMPLANTAPIEVRTWSMPLEKTSPIKVYTWSIILAKTAPIEVHTWCMPLTKTAPVKIYTWSMPLSETFPLSLALVALVSILYIYIYINH